MNDNGWMLRLESVSKSFTLHTQGGARLCVLRNLSLAVRQGESVALTGPSGIGKSSILRMIYGNYAVDRGRILVRNRGVVVDVTTASAACVLWLRRWTLGYVSQFLRVIPRVPTRQIVMEPLLERGVDPGRARERAEAVLIRLQIPKRLWDLSPTTFSGGEQQRVNIARVLVGEYPVLLLDEPTASLDPANREIVVEMIGRARERGTALLGVYHDPELRCRVAERTVDVGAFATSANSEDEGVTDGSFHTEALSDKALDPGDGSRSVAGGSAGNARLL
ncbi:alpha-D-ribose 1-methylphosphonate 5-triphosphate synthase subunit PhnL [Desulfacinum hydrothermale DSM 13146]|uniref:Alpha-D-ribose 1-methylphosphonate 5-triphosphate synthase subunit PhnL n=1 Tax=Desulfacinum hydrothermale DSM 13146 TaxID=1121390 RepID=A0A1W1XI12_9BACT|nr:phosphonate C-P lyase system protein PhnL [Desulfacinum hydrothermale]SMC23646.1 alpha-D-ribose 1-methylphosphonate 5-triphosphate synthase subunit PhnL [Desulfacinum hydrothermale DSM 13146]